MAELFSKEYLKELLTSDSWEGAAVVTAKAGLESLAGRIDEGGSGESLADRILSSGNGLVKDVTRQTIDHASEILEQKSMAEAESSAVGTADDSSDDGASAHGNDEPASSGIGLFSGEYLKRLLESDKLSDLVDKRVGANPTLDALPPESGKPPQ